MEFRKLRANEIDCRPDLVKSKGVSILLYKDARCDQNILDETVGSMNWQRHHTRDNANCIVSIWDANKKQWVEKEDTGTESNTEKEKGLASDSFKRACFNWGIGRELYSAPFIWFTDEQCNIEDNKTFDKFSVVDIEYSGNVISKLVVKNDKTGSLFKYNTKASNDTKPEVPKEDMITATQIRSITDLSVAYADLLPGKTTGDVMNILKVKRKFNNVTELTKDGAEMAIKQLKNWIEMQEEAGQQ